MTASDNDSNKILPGSESTESSGASAPRETVGDSTPVTAAAGSHGTAVEASARRQSLSRWLAAALVIAVIIIVALFANLRQQQERLDAFGREATRRLDDIVRRAEDAQKEARDALVQVQASSARLAAVERLAQTTEQQQKALEEAYRELTSADYEAILVDVEQSLILAAEQLQLAGRIPSAIATLQLAEARLVRAGRPAFLTAQQAIARDISRLQALPYTDLPAISQQVESAIEALRTFPLLSVTAPLETDRRADENVGAEDETGSNITSNAEQARTDAEWWERVWIPMRDWSQRVRRAAVDELESLVRVRRLDTPEALLVAPEQAELLRAQLVMRMLEARMALLGRFPDLWEANLAAVIDGVQRYGDTEAVATQRLLKNLRQLRQVELTPELPGLTDSLTAVRSLLAVNGGLEIDSSPDSDEVSMSPVGPGPNVPASNHAPGAAMPSALGGTTENNGGAGSTDAGSASSESNIESETSIESSDADEASVSPDAEPEPPSDGGVASAVPLPSSTGLMLMSTPHDFPRPWLVGQFGFKAHDDVSTPPPGSVSSRVQAVYEVLRAVQVPTESRVAQVSIAARRADGRTMSSRLKRMSGLSRTAYRATRSLWAAGIWS